MNKVLIVATSRKTRGGITSVVHAYEKGRQWNEFRCHWVQTHRDGSALRKILYLVMAWSDYVLRLPFCRIVHVHVSLPTSVRRKLPFVRLAKCLGKKVIVHFHCGNQLKDVWNPNYQRIISLSDVSLFLSRNILETVRELAEGQNDMRVCYNPCPDISEEPVLPRKKCILFSGTLYREKGYRDLIRSFGIIAHEFPDWKLIIAGNGEVDVARTLAADCGISGQVEFPGWVTGELKDRMFRQSSIFCLPSYAEGFPMAVLDAWAYGIPVITTPVGGIPDVAVDGENMLLFNPGDVDALSDCLKRLMGDANLRNTISKASSALAQNTFNIDVVNDKIGELYRTLLDN